MLTYYTDFCGIHNYTIDELIEIMKPWYDNYCFAEETYGKTTMYNSNMVLYFLYNYIDGEGRLPRNMVEDNIRVDYNNKLHMLIRQDNNYSYYKHVIDSLVQDGFITGNLKTGFPIETMCSPDNFISLLYYFGIVTISGKYRGMTKFTIPNKTIREHICDYMKSAL